MQRHNNIRKYFLPFSFLEIIKTVHIAVINTPTKNIPVVANTVTIATIPIYSHENVTFFQEDFFFAVKSPYP